MIFLVHKAHHFIRSFSACLSVLIAKQGSNKKAQQEQMCFLCTIKGSRTGKVFALCGHTFKHCFGVPYALELIFSRHALRNIAYAVFVNEQIKRQNAFCFTARECSILVILIEHLFAHLYSLASVEVGAVGYTVECQTAVKVFPLSHYLVHSVFFTELRREATPAFNFAV